MGWHKKEELWQAGIAQTTSKEEAAKGVYRMIPSALFCGELRRKDASSLEVRALEFAPDFFTFRISKKESPDFVFADLWFYDAARDRYDRVSTGNFVLRECDCRKYWTEYRFETADPEYKKSALKLTRDYLSYIDLRLQGDPEALSLHYTKASTGNGGQQDKRGNPDKRKVSPGSRTDGMKERGKSFDVLLPSGMSPGICLMTPGLWNAYLEKDKDTFYLAYLQKHLGGGKTAAPLRYLYIGSSFCPLLMPDDRTIADLLKKAEKDKLIPVFVFSVMSEKGIGMAKRKLSYLNHWCEEKGESLELEINDPGMCALIREEGWRHFVITAGVLPAKRRKDTRLFFLPGSTEKRVEDTSSDDPVFQALIPSDRETIESCLYLPRISRRHATLKAPYFQMNTGTFCPMQAAEETKDRGRQKEVTACFFVCEKKAFYYPDDLHMAGIGNTLFGYDPGAFDLAYLERAEKAGADRLVFDFPGGDLL